WESGVGSRESGVGSRESGVGSRESEEVGNGEIGKIIPAIIIVFLDTYLVRGVSVDRVSAGWDNYSDAPE
ncbi:MAG: hypothetical protein F6K56_28820, partial [Moorea sp. SIO3G5]|nr:hypothetical protein [Moorena sp. SIO3G5]